MLQGRRSGRRWVVVLVGLALVAAACTSKGKDASDSSTKSGDTSSERPADPMAKVNDSVTFTTTVDEVDGMSWLEQADDTARWEFSDFPDGLTDLVVRARVVVPALSLVEGAATVGLTYGTGDDEIGTQEVSLPVAGPAGGTDQSLVSGSFVIAADDLPDGLDELWVEAAGSPEQPVAVHTESVSFHPLRLRAGVDAGDDVPVTDEGTGTPPASTTTTPTSIAPAPTPTTGGGGAPVPVAPEFTSNGDQIQGWWWLRDGAGNHRARWTFPSIPTGGADIGLDFSMLATDRVSGGPGVDARFYLAWGFTDGDGRAVGGTGSRLVELPNTSPPEDTLGYRCEGSVAVPRADVPGEAVSMWVEASRVDPGGSGARTAEHVAFNAGALALGAGSGGGGTTTSSSTSSTTSSTTSSSTTTTTTEPDDGGIEEPPSVTVTYDGPDRAIDSSGSIFVDPDTDIDGDGLNQNFEDAAIEKANPVVEVDEEEMWLHFYDREPTFHFAQATLWPSAEDPTHVVIGYLSTWAYDAGGGLQQPANIVSEQHRGDSERIFTAWRIVGDDRIELEWVNTSAHKSITEHSGMWHVDDRQCVVGNVALVEPRVGAPPWTAGPGFTEVMCDQLEFDGEGRLVVYTAENKHAMYPSDWLCNSIDIARHVRNDTVYGENCGWDPGWWPGQWDDGDFENDDGQYLGGGRWRFRAYNVGEPGYPLIDDLDNASQWQRVSAEERTALLGELVGEAVWSGRYEDRDECRGSTCFCGGFSAGEEIALDWREDLEMPDACSGRLGTKYEEWSDLFLDAIASRYRVTLRTGGVDGAGTDERVVIELFDENEGHLASQWYEGDLERNATDVVYLAITARTQSGELVDPADVGAVRISRITGNDDRNPKWYLHEVEVEDIYTDESWTFTADTWILAGRYSGWMSD